MEKIRKVLMDNSSILYRIQNVLEFYAKGEDYDKDNGFLAKSLLKDIDDINQQYYIPDNIVDDKWSFEKEYEHYQIDYPHSIDPYDDDYNENLLQDEFVKKQREELLKLFNKLKNDE